MSRVHISPAILFGMSASSLWYLGFWCVWLRTGPRLADAAHLTGCRVESRMPVRTQRSNGTIGWMGCGTALLMFVQTSLCLEHAGGNVHLCAIFLLNMHAGCTRCHGRDVPFGSPLIGMMLHAHGKVCMDSVKAVSLCHRMALSRQQ